MMKAKGTVLVPTIAVIDRHIGAANRMNAFTAEERKRVDAFLEGIQQEIQMAKSLGVKIAAGFDAGSAAAQGKNATELEAMVKRGLTPLEAIQAATVSAAELLDWNDDIGVLEPGHYADVIAVDGNPLADITVLQRVKWVMKGGTVVKAATETAPAER
jgi:imidazolonepropionase-like amidohydrolase